MPKLTPPHMHQMSLGCDPEFFFKVNKRIVGAEHFIPKEGIQGRNIDSKFIIDGVQAELNPRPNSCRANLANEIAGCFRVLQVELDKSGSKVEVCFDQTVEISKEELDKLDKKNQMFGCDPSLSTNKGAGVKLAKVDPLKHLGRSAGGHIHIGHGQRAGLKKVILEHPDKLVEMLDIICGNTCVLVDRDEGNAKRRELYGAAGEYRLPEHGLEYRVLSNFWLQSAQMMSFSFGLVRLSCQLMSDDKHEMYYKAFTKAVNMKDIRTAINTNDYKLAYKNFKKIEKLLCEVTSDIDHFCLGPSTMKEFNFFVKSVNKNGLKHWFPTDPMKHWVDLPEAHAQGMHVFLVGPVRKALNKDKERLVKGRKARAEALARRIEKAMPDKAKAAVA